MGCSCSAFTICAICNVVSPVKCVLYWDISTFRSMCAVSNMAAFCSSLISCFPGLLLRYCVSDFEMVPVALLLLSYYYYYYNHHHHHRLLYAEYLYLYFWENYVPREYSVAAILLLLFIVLITLVSVLVIIIIIIIINVIFIIITVITDYKLKLLTIYNIIRQTKLAIIW